MTKSVAQIWEEYYISIVIYDKFQVEPQIDNLLKLNHPEICNSAVKFGVTMENILTKHDFKKDDMECFNSDSTPGDTADRILVRTFHAMAFPKEKRYQYNFSFESMDIGAVVYWASLFVQYKE